MRVSCDTRDINIFTLIKVRSRTKRLIKDVACSLLAEVVQTIHSFPCVKVSLDNVALGCQYASTKVPVRWFTRVCYSKPFRGMCLASTFVQVCGGEEESRAMPWKSTVQKTWTNIFSWTVVFLHSFDCGLWEQQFCLLNVFEQNLVLNILNL